MQAVMATALVVGCAAASVTLWYYSRRYVGEMSLLQRPGDAQPSLCFSVLDFWGNREVGLGCAFLFWHKVCANLALLHTVLIHA